MSVRKYKPESYSAEKSRDSNFIHAEKLAKLTAQNVERSKKAMKESNRLLKEREKKGLIA